MAMHSVGDEDCNFDLGLDVSRYKVVAFFVQHERIIERVSPWLIILINDTSILPFFRFNPSYSPNFSPNLFFCSLRCYGYGVPV